MCPLPDRPGLIGCVHPFRLLSHKFLVTFQIQPRGGKADLLRRVGVAPTPVPPRLRGMDRQHRRILRQPAEDEPGRFHLLLHLHLSFTHG